MDNPYQPPTAECTVLSGREYQTIGTRYFVGRLFQKQYFGTVIASRDAFYFVKDHERANVGFAVVFTIMAMTLTPFLGQPWNPIILLPLAGVSGAALGALVQKFVPRRKNPFESNYSDLPTAVVQHHDWPLLNTRATKVIIIPRSAVKRIKYWSLHTFDLVTIGPKYAIVLGLFNRGQIIAFLREMGWEF